MPSNIRVSVNWNSSSVFSGESVECLITIKNASTSRNADRLQIPSQRSNGHFSGLERRNQANNAGLIAKPQFSRASSVSSQAPTNTTRGHRPTPSLSPSSHSRQDPQQHHAAAWVPDSPKSPHSHGRSLSIVSLGNLDREGPGNGARQSPNARLSGKRHNRATSLQIVPGRNLGTPPPPFVSNGSRSNTQPMVPSDRSPSLVLQTPEGEADALRPQDVSIKTTGPQGTPISFQQNFQFPGAAQASSNDKNPHLTPELESSPKTAFPQSIPATNRLQDPQSGKESLSPVARILAGTSIEGTPRSSGEFYSVSNNSSETLASEYAPSTAPRPVLLRSQSKQKSQLSRMREQSKPEVLMMGYVQLIGSFTIDGSLINQGPFEEVKRRGFVSNQGGGGVVGVDKSKNDSGLFGSFGWSNFGESLGGLLGGSEPSSIRDMKTASAKSIPLISTPQSILFVDLKLAPGESRSFRYKITLPKGLPPTHKGRAIKVEYHLSIGLQRPGSARSQQLVKHIDVPFRVFCGVTEGGDVLGHDLMIPHVILKDTANIVPGDESASWHESFKKTPTLSTTSGVALSNFENYVSELLGHEELGVQSGLLSPTVSQRENLLESDHNRSMKDVIDQMIMRCHIVDASVSSSKFEISRSGLRVAVVQLARGIFKLGETIQTLIDFRAAEIPCYSVHIYLESFETIDPAIALRSNASIHRATRRVHAYFADNALFAERLSFTPTIPANATPEFRTTGVSLEWKIRVEFFTPRLAEDLKREELREQFFEEISSDDRGISIAAVERLLCENFEISIPLRVFGSTTASSERYDIDEASL